MRLVNEKNIAKISFVYAIIMVAVMTFSAGGLLTYSKYSATRHDIEKMEEEFISLQKDLLKKEVNKILARLETSREEVIFRITENMQIHSHEALTIAENVFNKYHTIIPDDHIKGMIRESLRAIRFNDGHSFFFISDQNGTSVLHPLLEHLEGTNYLNNRNNFVRNAIQRFINKSILDGEGYLRYAWPELVNNSMESQWKIAYICTFKPFSWIIGTTESTDSINSMAEADITRELLDIFHIATEEYTFIYKIHNIAGGKDFATLLIDVNHRELEGKLISDDVVDTQGTPYRQRFMEGIRDKGEAFITYMDKKPDDSGTSRKLTYFKLDKEWNWVVAQGIYFDQLEHEIQAIDAKMIARMKHDILLLCILFFVAATIALLPAYLYSRELQAIFTKYKETQNEHTQKLQEMNKKLHKLNQTDTLTGIYNRRYFNSRLAKEHARALRYERPFCIIMFDIDHFKLINDTFGHLQGDAVLIELSTLVQKNIRSSDMFARWGDKEMFARWGGEEFVILAIDQDLDKGTHFAEKIRQKIEKHPFPIPQNVTCSFGIACFSPPEEPQTLLNRADTNLYEAKENGRNRCIGK